MKPSSTHPGQDENVAPPAPAPTAAAADTADTILSPTQIMLQRLSLVESIQTSVRNAIALQEETSRELLALANQYLDSRTNIHQTELLALDHLYALDKDLQTMLRSSSNKEPIGGAAPTPSVGVPTSQFLSHEQVLMQRLTLSEKIVESTRKAVDIGDKTSQGLLEFANKARATHDKTTDALSDLAARYSSTRKDLQQLELDALEHFKSLDKELQIVFQKTPDPGRPRPLGSPPHPKETSGQTPGQPSGIPKPGGPSILGGNGNASDSSL